MPTLEEKIARCTTYLEPDLYVLVQQAATENDERSVASWLRGLIIRELIQKDKLNQELLIKLLAK